MKEKQKVPVSQPELSPLQPILAGYVSIDRGRERTRLAKGNELFVGECLDDRHPSLFGRVLVRWKDSNSNLIEHWLPTLQGLSVRKMDRVLLQKPVNWPDPIVFGVVDGCADRPAPERLPINLIELKPDELVRVDSHTGQPLIEVYQENGGPVVRLLADDVNLDLNGKLKISARSIDLSAKKGKVSISASSDVVVKGEVIELN